MVRAPGIAPGTADWQTATLLLRHARTWKLGPCRAWAAGWLHTDPIGQSGLRSRIENRRFLKENGRPDGSRTRIPRLERPGSLTVRQGGKKRTRGRHRRLTTSGAPRVCFRNSRCANSFSQKRTHTVVPLGRRGLPDWTAAGFSCGRWADWLGSALKPLGNMGKGSDSFPGSGPNFRAQKNPLPGGSGRPRARLR